MCQVLWGWSELCGCVFAVKLLNSAALICFSTKEQLAKTFRKYSHLYNCSNKTYEDGQITQGRRKTIFLYKEDSAETHSSLWLSWKGPQLGSRICSLFVCSLSQTEVVPSWQICIRYVLSVSKIKMSGSSKCMTFVRGHKNWNPLEGTPQILCRSYKMSMWK